VKDVPQFFGGIDAARLPSVGFYPFLAIVYPSVALFVFSTVILNFPL